MSMLAINKSHTKIMRAGFGNLVIPISAVFLILINQHLSDVMASEYLRYGSLIALLLIMINLYLSVVSQVKAENGVLEFTTPVRTKRLSGNKIKDIKVHLIPASYTVLIFVWFHGKRIPSMYFFVAYRTGAGDFKKTVESVSEMFSSIKEYSVK